jgi:competence protein ComEC
MEWGEPEAVAARSRTFSRSLFGLRLSHVSMDNKSLLPLVFYVACLSFGVGIALGTFVRPSVWILGLCTFVVVAVALLLRRTNAPPLPVGVLVAGIFVLLGLLRTEVAWSGVGQSVLEGQVNSAVVLEGVVTREPEVREQSQHLYVATADATVLVIADRYEPVAFGDRLQVSGTLVKPEAFITDLGRTFDYPGYLLARGVEYQIRYPDLARISGGEGGTVVGSLYALKAAFVTALGTVLPEPEQSLAIGLLLGVKQSLGEALEQVFRDSGIIHIVVLSGYNLMIVASFIMLVLAYVAGLRTRVVLGIVAILLFATMVGWSATVARATIMAILALLALMLGRRYLVLRGLCVAGAVMLALNPFLLIYDVGFQLSFLATLGLIVVAPRLETALLAGAWWQPVSQFLVATVAAQVAVTPLLLYHMGEVSLVAIITNVLVLPAVPIAMLLSFITGLVALVVPVMAPLVSYPTVAVLWYIIEQARFWAGVPYATVAFPVFSFWYVALAYLLLGLWWYRAAQSVTAKDSSGPIIEESAPVDLRDWTIIRDEEASVRLNPESKNAAIRSRDAAPADRDVPVFFR